MTVVRFEAARRRLRATLPTCWQPSEMAELIRLYEILHARGGASGFECGETERCEPQFYVLSADLGPCIACVSCIAKDGRPWYLLENGSGGLLGEGHDLGTLVGNVSQRWQLLVGRLLLVAPMFGQLLAASGDTLEESLQLAASSPLGAAMAQALLSWTTQALALA
jgi:hypothetical protein